MIKQAKKTKKESTLKTESKKAPAGLKHVAIIMDGNRRWADRKHIPRVFGHKEGVTSLKRLVKHAAVRGLEFMTVYAFSSENWQRGQEEVDYLFELFTRVLRDELEELHKNNVRLKFIGKLDEMPAHLQQGFTRAMTLTSENTGLRLQVALNYGSRLEISEACKTIAKKVCAGDLCPDEISPELISEYLYTKGIPDPDLLIRTGGEMRLSNYLLWQSAYSELYVTELMWPEFNELEFDKALEEFAQRQRRWGGD